MHHVDLLVVGGGLVGSSLAAAVCSHPLANGLSVMLVDPKPPKMDRWPSASLRTSTITPSSREFLHDIEVWSRLPDGRIAPFHTMFVWDHPDVLPVSQSFTDLTRVPAGTIHFDAADIGAEQLGHVVDNDSLRYAIYQRLHELMNMPGSDLQCIQANLKSIEYDTASLDLVAATNEPDKSQAQLADDSVPWPVVQLESGERIRCRLIVACDGARSRVRTLAGADWFSLKYNQSAVVANVKLQEPITTAYQRFLSTGPIAVLPVASEDTAVPLGNVIWSTTHAEADALTAADDRAFLNEVNAALRDHEDGDFAAAGYSNLGNNNGDVELWKLAARGLQVILPSVGLSSRQSSTSIVSEPPECTSIFGNRGRFPLTMGHAPRYVIHERRTVLVGDAAHSVHPLAGQGVNLGFGDAQSLVDCIASANATGRDIGGEMGAPLMRFQGERLVNNVAMMSVLHGLQKVFDVGGSGGRFRDLRRVGISALNAVSPMKRLIIRAMR